MRQSPTSAVTLRAARASDAAFVRQLGGRAFAEYDPRAARTTGYLMDERGARTLIAERAERALGFVILQPEPGAVLSLNAIAVVENERGRGVGRRLMQGAEDYARAEGFRTIALTTAQANLAALDLFLRAGFEIVDRSFTRYFGRQPACHLSKQLP